MNKEFHQSKRQAIGEYMEPDSILVMFAGEPPVKSEDENYEFVPNRNFYYLTGIDKPSMILMLTKHKGEVKETIFIEKADPTMEKWIGKKMTDEEAKELTGIENVQYIEDFWAAFGKILYNNPYDALYLDLNLREPKIPTTEAQIFSREVMERYPFIRIKNIYHKFRELRVIKTEEEVESIRKAIAITNEGILNMMRNARPGIGEHEMEAHFDFTLKTELVNAHAFPSIVAGGVNAAVLHYVDNNCTIQDDNMLLIDLGATYNYYSADISRTFPINGKYTDRQKQLYNIVLKAQLETIKAIKPGVPFRELNKVTERVLIEGCKEIGLIKEDKDIAKYYYHGVSHYLGLDTHDIGDYEVKLEKGMVLTVEPGLYVEEEAIGIRIEDDVLVTEDGCENLSRDIIKTVEEIEEFMRK